MSKTLDMGCGSKPRNPFNAAEMYGVDIVDGLGPNIRKADLAIEPIRSRTRASSSSPPTTSSSTSRA